jgi:MTH538 TIR-like domain (DUF1863)
MARKVFFSFHYQNDIFRVNIVRNHFLTKGGYLDSGYFDDSLWEKAKSQSSQNLQNMINDGLQDTTVSVILIGSETANRPWVKYEIEQAMKRGNGFVGIRIHNIECAQTGSPSLMGPNPLDLHFCKAPQVTDVAHMGEPIVPLSRIYLTYDWVNDDGYNNFQDWVEAAARTAGK